MEYFLFGSANMSFYGLHSSFDLFFSFYELSDFVFSIQFRYTFEHLDKGYYSFRVRSVSLALTGAYTEYQFINVYDKSYSIIAIIGIIFFICLFVILVGTVVIYFCRDLIHRLRVRSLNASTQNILMQIDESDAPHEEEPPSFYRTLTDDRDTF